MSDMIGRLNAALEGRYEVERELGEGGMATVHLATDRETGKKVAEEFALWEPCHRQLLGNGIVGFENVGGDIDKVTGKRVTIAAFPWRWVKGDGCIGRMVAIVDPKGEFRL